MLPLISVVTPTIRGLRALRPVEQSLKSQTFDSFEWLVEFGDGKAHSLNRDFNTMLRRARGELVVFAEDWMWFGPTGLELFWKRHQEKPDGFFTSPVSKTVTFTDNGVTMVHGNKLQPEWRSEAPGVVRIDFVHWECDWAAAPLDILKAIGGVGEHMDSAWGNDNGNLAYRAEKAGYVLWCDPGNPAVGLKHDEIWEHPFRKNFNVEHFRQRLMQFENGLKLERL